MTSTPVVYVGCPDTNVPSGGIKQLYRHVDVLNKNGFSSYIVHEKEGFRCTWFENQTPVVYRSQREPEINPYDYLVLPECYGPAICDYMPGIKKVIFNQNAHMTFDEYPIDKQSFKTPYLNPDLVATLVVSEHNYNYLCYVFPKLRLFRIHNGIDTALFNYSPYKKKQIAFMPRRLPQDVVQVINILKFRGVLEGFELAPIHDRTEQDTAAILRDSLIFLSFSDREGGPLPPKEALACGCIVIGYHGNSGTEYFDEDFCYPIASSDTIAFSRTVEAVINQYRENSTSFREKAKRGSEYVTSKYSIEREEADIIRFWKSVFANEL